MDSITTQSQHNNRYIKEGDTCPNWEQCDRPCIAPLRECWFCKWSSFDLDAVQHETTSICQYPNKRVE